MKRLYLNNKYVTTFAFGIVLLSALWGIPQTLFSPQTAFAATPSIDAISTGPVGNNTITWQHTITNNTNGLLLVYIQGSGQNVSSVTYNGIAMSNGLIAHNGTVGIDKFVLFNPPTGTHAIVVSGSSTLMGGAISLYNVNQTDPWDHSSYNNNCSQSQSVFCFHGFSPARSTELWLQLTAIDDSDTLTFTPMATGTKMWALHSGTAYLAAEYLPGVDGTIVPSWSIAPNPQNNYTSAQETEVGIQVATIPTPTLLLTPTPTPVTYTISGNVYNDGNKNGSKDAGESNYAGSPTITASRGIVTTQSDGTYTISNLTAGLVTVSYNSLPSGYSMTYPLNGPPSSFQVNVGPGCLTNGANGAICQ